MPSSKKKVKSAVTLHDFFNVAGNSSISVQEKRKATGHHKSLVTPEDIIIIDDSDSEPEVVQVIRSTKRRRRSNSSGEVTFVENPGASTDNACVSPAIACSFRKAQDITSHNGLKQKPSNPIVSKPSSCPNGAALRQETPTQNCAIPSLLDTGFSAGVTFTEPSSHSVLSFGEATLLLQNDGTTSILDQDAAISRLVLPGTECQELQIPDETNNTMNLHLPPDVGDDWGTGDDEITLAPVPDEEEEKEDLTVIDSDHERVTKCPSCDILLNGLSHLVSPDNI